MDAISGPVTVTPTINLDEITSEKVIKDPTFLYGKVSKRTLMSLLTELPENGYALNTSLRERLLKPVCSHLEINRKATRSYFDPNGSEPDEPDAPTLEQRWLMKSAVYDQPGIGIGIGIGSQVKAIAESMRSTGDTLTLPDIKKIPVNTPFAIYNKNNNKPITVLGEQSSDSLSMTLKANHGAIIQTTRKGNSLQWETLSNYESKTRNSPANPILVEIPTKEEKLERKKIKDSGKSKEHLYKGEPFLTPAMVQELAAEATALPKPDFYKHKTTTIDPFQKLLTGKTEKILDNGKRVVTTNLIVQSSSCEHMIHLRLIRDDSNNIFIYMHETLEPGSEIALNINDGVMDAVAELYSNYNIYLLRPGFQLQKDSSCCSQFALESMLAFHETSDLDEWIMKTAKDADALVHLPTVRRRNKAEPGSLIKDDKFYIPADKMHVQLLKSNQNIALLPDNTRAYKLPAGTDKAEVKPYNAENITDAQLDTVVDNETGQTLREHYQKHTVSVPDENNAGQTSDINLFATGLRYRNILKWDKLQKEKTQQAGIKRKTVPVSVSAKTQKQKLSPYNESLKHLREVLAAEPELPKDKLLTMAAQTITEKAVALDEKEKQISQLQTLSKTKEEEWQRKFDVRVLEASKVEQQLKDMSVRAEQQGKEIAYLNKRVAELTREVDQKNSVLAKIHDLSR